MHSLLQKSLIVLIFTSCIANSDLCAQSNIKQDPGPAFVEQGTFLTGFSLSFINASRANFNQEFEREFTDISIQIDGLYFVNNRIGVGPLLGYRFTYRDLVDPFQNSDSDTRFGQFQFGGKAGWYIPTRKLFGGSGNTRFFVDAGLSWLRAKFRREDAAEADADYQFGYQIGTGFLFPVGKRIALETRLGFQARRQKITLLQFNAGSQTTVTKWIKEVALNLGLKVTF